MRGDRLVIGLRTFSKFYALAGARVGYAYARPDLIVLIRNAEHIFGIASLSESAAVAALSDTAHIATVRAAFLAERARVTGALQEMGLAPCRRKRPLCCAGGPTAWTMPMTRWKPRESIWPAMRFTPTGT